MTCRLDTASYSGAFEMTTCQARDVFGCVIDGWLDDTIEVRFNGSSGKSHRSDIAHCVLLPREQRLVTASRGSAAARFFWCEIDHGAFSRVFGDSLRDFEFEPHFGASPMRAELVRQLASLCYEPSDAPLAYIEALGTILLVDLFRGFRGAGWLPTPPGAMIGAKRFKPVIDYIESSLEQELSLYDLASIVGLSVFHFARAFKSTYGVAPYRYIVQRRITRAKTLLSTTDDTVTAIAFHVGFSSKSRFTQLFAKLTGSTPTQYRSLRSSPKR
jgi:AraC-like DNA-binding protein